MKRVVAWPETHSVMPRDREGPPDKSPKNRLTDRTRDNVSFTREEPAHCCSIEEGERHENGVLPMPRRKMAQSATAATRDSSNA